jgi:hypothetical protein
MSDIKSDKIRTSPQPGPRNAWIGNPHHRNCMVEVGAKSLPGKVHPDRKTAIKQNSTVSDGELVPPSLTVEFFDLPIFSLGALLPAIFC